MRYMPLSRYRTGTYEYWFSQSRRYSTQTRIYGVKITIFRRIRSSSASAADGGEHAGRPRHADLEVRRRRRARSSRARRQAVRR